MDNETPVSILIVDDNSKNLQVLADILRRKDYRVAMTKDGEKALRFVEKRKPDMILLDIMMPDMDGYEVCQKLKENEETKEIPVIFISALSDIADKVKGFRVGGIDYITKPFQEEEVLARVKTHLKLKFAQEKLKAINKQLRDANATKDKLFSIIAHDLRSPIARLIQALDYIRSNSEEMNEEIKTSFLDELGKSTKRTYDLLENLLCWARSQRGEIDFSPEYIDLKFIVDSTINMVSDAAKEKQILIYSQIEDDVIVYADINMVSILLRNLISNALKFTNDRGEIKVNAVSGEDMVEISVSDNGVGVSEEDIEKLFRSDIHFTTYGTRNEKGSGLGLMLCGEFIEKNGGKIWVESQLGIGSTFKFTLPKP